MSNNRSPRFVPLIIAVSIVVGIIIGMFYTNHFTGNRLGIINTSSNKLNDLLRIIEDQYVDSVDEAELVENSMSEILSELDPHSVYISAKDAQAADDDLKGSFSGIGIQFTIRKDTIHVNNVIKGGPSEKIGIMPGDRIISVDGKPFVGKEVTNQEAMRRLKGPKDSKVKLGIKRRGVNKTLYFTIIRGDIPVRSVDASYLITPTVGYLKINKFAETTYSEMMIALAQLSQLGMKQLIIDLRGNTGGIMDAAINMSNEFLQKNQLIVYTQGRKHPRKDYRSDGKGAYRNIPLCVLIDEGSASASEIFAGAMQDNDRADIIGRRSFGKGLVQQPMGFRDGSVIRLTRARYYSPSGRCIQKPYEKGHDENYEMDLITRYERGEFFSQDSIKQNGPKFKTLKGRTVYGGGGIMPDIFVPEDTTSITSYYRESVNSGLVLEFAYQYTDENREKMQKYGTSSELAKYLKNQGLVHQFVNYAEKKGLKRRNLMIQKSYNLFENTLIGSVIYNMLDIESYIEFKNKQDATVKKAILQFE